VKVLKILVDECDPEKYLAEYDCFYKVKAETMNKSPVHYINRYAALTALGRYDEARQIIWSAPTPEIVNKPYYYFLYYINSAHLDINDGNIIMAQQKLDYVKTLKISPKYQSIVENAIDGNIAEILRKQGYLTESRMLLIEILQREISKINMLNCIFDLGLIDVYEQRYNEAIAAFSRVINEGNKLYLVTLARQELEKILG
jgi:tetratricopeptide (TPR) repeat protein